MGGNLFGVGFGELLFLAILILVLLGPKRIPELLRTVGHFMGQVRRAGAEMEYELRHWVQDLEAEGPPLGRQRAVLPPRVSGDDGMRVPPSHLGDHTPRPEAEGGEQAGLGPQEQAPDLLG
ncbi:MAG: twin-arginine translocase TatA/TatE family subunit [Chloroflexia bacterium]|nr:twin-arginine translocase TatA/TatE family subunit [Chloroflexia bacterium]